jgi:hypothetical protein
VLIVQHGKLEVALREVLLVVGVALAALGVGLFLVVGVNLPDSAFGMFYVGIVVSASAICISYALRSTRNATRATLILGVFCLLTGAAALIDRSRASSISASGALFEIVVLLAGVVCVATFVRFRRR